MNMRNPLILVSLIGITFLAWYISRNSAHLTQISDVDTIVVGTNAEFPPFSFIEHDQIVGFDIDLAQEVAKRLHKKIRIKNMSFEALIPEIQLGSIHLIAAGISPTEQRAKRLFFTKPYFDNDPLVIVQPLHASAIDNSEKLMGKTIIVNQGYTADRYLSAIKGVHVMRISSALISTGILALQSGKADAYITAKSSLQPYIEKHGAEELQITPLKETEELYALAVSKKYPILYQQIQKALIQLEKDGTLKSLRTKWKL